MAQATQAVPTRGGGNTDLTGLCATTACLPVHAQRAVLSTGLRTLTPVRGVPAAGARRGGAVTP
eukprot:4835073-Alexandrium_andersonii.AAC.1